MPPAGYLVATRLLLLFVVGSADPELIAKHRRLESYSAADYAALRRLLNGAGRVYVTPNTITKTSNLLEQHGEPEGSRLFRRLQSIVQDSREIVVVSATATAHPAFTRLGLTDAVLLETAAADTPLLTMDFQLHAAGLAKGPDLAVVFLPANPAIPKSGDGSAAGDVSGDSQHYRGGHRPDGRNRCLCRTDHNPAAPDGCRNAHIDSLTDEGRAIAKPAPTSRCKA